MAQERCDTSLMSVGVNSDRYARPSLPLTWCKHSVGGHAYRHLRCTFSPHLAYSPCLTACGQSTVKQHSVLTAYTCTINHLLLAMLNRTAKRQPFQRARQESASIQNEPWMLLLEFGEQQMAECSRLPSYDGADGVLAPRLSHRFMLC